MRMEIGTDGTITLRSGRYCIDCGEQLDEGKAVLIPGATAEEESTAEVVNYARFFPDSGFGDSRWWCGSCWRSSPINQPQEAIVQHDWPTRAEWAKQVRTWDRRFDGFDDDDPVRVSSKVSDYMSPDEIAALIADLKALRSQLGKARRELVVQSEYQIPRLLLTATQAIKAVNEDRIPRMAFVGDEFPELAELQRRWQAAYDAEAQRIENEYASRPIDDGAWAKELARRAEVERINACLCKQNERDV